MWLPIFKIWRKESPHLGLMSVTSVARDLKAVVYTEFNIEEIRNIILDLVLECKPEQVTLVPTLLAH
jgi:pyridoxine 5'-phosphate synthase PdxJ